MAGNSRALRVVLLLGTALLWSTSACGVEPGKASPSVEWLDRVVAAENTYTFEGIREVSAQFGPHTRTNWYFQAHGPGAACTTFSTGQPAGRQRRSRFSLPRLFWLRDRALLLRNYGVTIVGNEMVAERPGVVLEIRGIRDGRPSVRLVADKKTGLLLGMERRDYRGELVFRSRFKTFLVTESGAVGRGVEEEKPRWRPRPRGGRRGEWPIGPDKAFVPLVTRYLPAGFVRRAKEPGSRFGGQGHHELFSDGLCWLSMSQRAAQEGAEERVIVQRQWGDRAVLEMVYCGVKVKLMGGLAPEELTEMMRSLAPADPGEH